MNANANKIRLILFKLFHFKSHSLEFECSSYMLIVLYFIYVLLLPKKGKSKVALTMAMNGSSMYSFKTASREQEHRRAVLSLCAFVTMVSGVKQHKSRAEGNASFVDDVRRQFREAQSHDRCANKLRLVSPDNPTSILVLKL